MAHDMHMMMKSYFHFGFGDQFLFQNLVVDSNLKMWGTCGVMFAITLIFEAIKYVRCVRCGCQQVSKKSAQNNCHESSENNNGDANIDTNDTTEIRLGYQHNLNCYVGRFRSQRHRFIQTLLHTAQTTLGFIIMLAVMSFNLCIIFAILVGKSQQKISQNRATKIYMILIIFQTSTESKNNRHCCGLLYILQTLQ